MNDQCGVCRHRSAVFMVLARYLGIPTNIVINDRHEFVHVLCRHSDTQTKWVTYDLFGTHYKAPDKEKIQHVLDVKSSGYYDKIPELELKMMRLGDGKSLQERLANQESTPSYSWEPKGILNETRFIQGKAPFRDKSIDANQKELIITAIPENVLKNNVMMVNLFRASQGKCRIVTPKGQFMPKTEIQMQAILCELGSDYPKGFQLRRHDVATILGLKAESHCILDLNDLTGLADQVTVFQTEIEKLIQVDVDAIKQKLNLLFPDELKKIDSGFFDSFVDMLHRIGVREGHCHLQDANGQGFEKTESGLSYHAKDGTDWRCSDCEVGRLEWIPQLNSKHVVEGGNLMLITSNDSFEVIKQKGKYAYVPELNMMELIEGERISTEKQKGRFRYLPGLKDMALIDGVLTMPNGVSYQGTFTYGSKFLCTGTKIYPEGKTEKIDNGEVS